MQCTHIRVENFRNIKEADVSFTDGVNLLVGDNAQGKTNLLEAIYLCALGKTFRQAKDAGVDRLAAWTYRGGYGTVVGAPDALKLWDTIGESYNRLISK